jgi:hypothetical protein
MMATYRYKKSGAIYQDFICARCSNKRFGLKVPRSVYEECVR